MGNESDRVYAEITTLIRDGKLVAGTPLRESSIAATIGVSRTPVREALRRLAAEGTVELEPNRGATLVDLSQSDIEDIFVLRGFLEPYAARLAAARATEANLERLEKLYAEMDARMAEGDLDAVTVLNTEFHREILNAADARLVRDAVALVTRSALVRRTFGRYTPEQQRRSQQHHRDLIDAIRAGNGRWAEATMRSHIEAGREVS